MGRHLQARCGRLIKVDRFDGVGDASISLLFTGFKPHSTARAHMVWN